MKPAKIQKTNGIPDYWDFFCNLKKHEGWIRTNSSPVIKQYLQKEDKKITYEQFSELIKGYYKQSGIYLIRGYRLRFDYGLGNLRIIKYDGKERNLSGYRNPENIDTSTPQCVFYFHKDVVDLAKRKRELGQNTIENFNDFDLLIARSNSGNDKSLGLKYKLSKMIKNNPDLTRIYDVRKFDNNI